MSAALRRRLLAVLTRLYPREFREEYAAAMLSHCDEGGWRELIRTIWDVLSSAIAMRAESLWRDLSYAARTDAKAPLFTIVVVGTLAVAIAANAVIFTILDAVLLKPLPFAQADRLGLVWQVPSGPSALPGSLTSLPMTAVDALRADSKSLASVAADSPQQTQLGSGSETQSANENIVTRNYFALLGLHPEIGRFFSAGSRALHEAVISDALWHKRFGGTIGALGRTLLVGGKPYTIVGVAPAGLLDPGFNSLAAHDVWTVMPPSSRSSHIITYSVFPLVRLRPGSTWQAAQADIARVQTDFARHNLEFPTSPFRIAPLSDVVFHDARAFLWLVFGAVGGVVLIACANVGNLLLVRGSVRAGEFAVRSALGATGRRIASQLLTETALLAAAGAVIGLLLARLTLPIAVALMPNHYPRLASAHIGASVLLYVCGLLIVVTLLAGMLPVWAHARPGESLKQAGRTALGGGSRIRFALVALEVAIAFALIVSSGLLLRSFVSLTNVDIGFSPKHLYVAPFMPQSLGFDMPMTKANPFLAKRIEQRIGRIPGVAGTAVATVVPFTNLFMMYTLEIAGRPVPPASNPNAQLQSAFTAVTPNYFKVMRIKLLRGRSFSSGPKGAPSVLVNEAFARRFFPGGHALGKRIGFGGKEMWPIVGIVGNTRNALTQTAQPLGYTRYDGSSGPFFQVVIKTAHAVPTLARDVAITAHQLDPTAGKPSLISLREAVAAGASQTRTSLILLGTLAGIALLLALAGIYSIVAYGTERRFREIGIRMALGATPASILAQIVRGALAQTVAGIVLGIVLAAFTTRLLQRQLFATSPLDPATFIAVIAVITLCTAAAAFVPALRAARAHPATTLRYE